MNSMPSAKYVHTEHRIWSMGDMKICLAFRPQVFCMNVEGAPDQKSPHAIFRMLIIIFHMAGLCANGFHLALGNIREVIIVSGDQSTPDCVCTTFFSPNYEDTTVEPAIFYWIDGEYIRIYINIYVYVQEKNLIDLLYLMRRLATLYLWLGNGTESENYASRKCLWFVQSMHK